jgi:hypothetical protein
VLSIFVLGSRSVVVREGLLEEVRGGDEFDAIVAEEVDEFLFLGGTFFAGQVAIEIFTKEFSTTDAYDFEWFAIKYGNFCVFEGAAEYFFACGAGCEIGLCLDFVDGVFCFEVGLEMLFFEMLKKGLKTPIH